MKARIKIALIGLAAAAALPFTPDTGAAQGVYRSGATIIYTLSVQVPSVVKLVVDPTAKNPDGTPLLRVLTNDRAIRAAAAQGITPQLIQLASAPEGRELHAKGSEAPATSRDEGPVLRYTVVTR